MSISIALTKGRLEKETVKLLDKANFGTEDLRTKGEDLFSMILLRKLNIF